MVRTTSSFSMLVPITIPARILSANPNRLLYSIQNLDVANYIAIGPKNDITAGAFALHEGQHVAAQQPMSDDTDVGEVWAVANTAAVNIAVVEISDQPGAGRGRIPEMRADPRSLRTEARTW